MSFKEHVLKKGDAVIGTILILIFLSASFIADLWGVSAVMDNQIATWNQWLIAGGCVMLKALGLIKTREAFRRGYWPSAIAMGALTALAVIVSMTNEMTYYNTNFSGKAARLQSAADTSGDVAKEKGEIEARLQRNAGVRPIATIEGEITEGLAHPIRGDRRGRLLGAMTHDCTATKSPFYDQCQDVLALRTELANAVVVTPEIEKDKRRLEAIRASKNWVTTVGEVNPGAGFWVRTYNHIVDWRGLGAEHHISNQSGQDALVIVLMLILQSINLFLPFGWFYGSDVGSGADAYAHTFADPITEAPLPIEATSGAGGAANDLSTLADDLANTQTPPLDARVSKPKTRSRGGNPRPQGSARTTQPKDALIAEAFVSWVVHTVPENTPIAVADVWRLANRFAEATGKTLPRRCTFLAALARTAGVTRQHDVRIGSERKTTLYRLGSQPSERPILAYSADACITKRSRGDTISSTSLVREARLPLIDLAPIPFVRMAGVTR